MQALSSYNPEKQSTIGMALRDLEQENVEVGLTASTWVSRPGWFARFVWPDWPSETVAHVSKRVQHFHATHCELVPLLEGSSEWNAVFHGWRSDPASAEAIASAFSKHFGERLLWVLSQRDTRGRIGARCRIRELVRSESFSVSYPLGQILKPPTAAESEVVSLELSWKDSFARPRGPLSDSDRELFQASVTAIANWAARRIQPILDALHEQLHTLYGERFRGLYVFGSYARPDAGIELPEDSDLDVALILTAFENPYEEIERFGEITSALTRKHGLLVSVIPIRESDYLKGSTNFVRVIKEDAIAV